MRQGDVDLGNSSYQVEYLAPLAVYPQWQFLLVLRGKGEIRVTCGKRLHLWSNRIFI